MERYSVLQQSIGGIYIRCSCMRNTKAGASDRDCWSRRKHMRICQGAVRITSEVSLTARPFFERKGYRVDREQQIDRGGVLLTNFLMYKTLS